MNTPPCHLYLYNNNKEKIIGYANTCNTLIIFSISNTSHSLTCPKTCGKRPKRLKILKNDHFSLFISLSTPPCWNRSQSKSKSIRHAYTWITFIISCNSIVSHSFTYPKSWGKGPKWLNLIFHNFEYSPLPTFLIKQNKNDWTCNYMWHSYYFVQL